MQKTTILIVEDEAIIAADLAAKLSFLGYDVIGTVASGEEAVENACLSHPQLVLMDISLKGSMDGIAAAQRIRGELDIPVIYLTAHSDSATLASAKITEPFGYVLKPLDERELATAIEMALYKHQSERQLREEKERLSALVNSIHDEVWFADTQKRFTLANPSALREFGFDSTGSGIDVEELAKSLEIFRADGTPRPISEAPPLRALEGEAVRNLEEIIRIPSSGELRHRQVNASPVRDGKGNIIGSVSVVRDITDRKRAEEKLQEANEELTAANEELQAQGQELATSYEELRRAKESIQAREQILSEIIHKSPSFVCVLRGPDHVIEIANEKYMQLIGKRDILGKKLVDALPEITDSPYLEILDRVYQTGESFSVNDALVMLARGGGGELEEVRLDFVYLPLREADGTVTGIFAHGIDITERKRAEEAVRNNEARLVAVMDNLTEGLVIANAEGLVFYWNPAAIAMHGYASMDECRRKLDEFPDTFELRPLDDDRPLPVADWPMNRVLRGEVLRDFEMLVRRLDQGWEKVVVYCGSLIKSASGEMLAFLSITDITDRKRADEKLRQATRRFQTIIDHAPVAIYIKNREGRFVMGNRRLEHYTGLPVERLLGMTDYDFAPKEDADRWRKNDLKILEGEQVEFEETGIDREGRPYVNISVKFPLSDESGTPVEVCGISTDITERKAAEDALCKTYAEMEQQVAERTRELRDKDQMLIMQSRQAAMGEMLGNIAHQWRQPLNSVGMIMQALTVMHDAGELGRNNLVAMEDQVMELVRHMSRTIDDFRDFFRPNKEKADFSVRKAVDNTVSLVEASFKNRFIATEINMEDDPVISGYQNEYSQALLNILQNARDAFERKENGEAKVVIAVGKENGRSVVTITDNAGGITDDILHKVFDPYFTTKGPDKGTGVGLFMAKTIIEKNMGGRLTVRNTTDGAEFRIEV